MHFKACALETTLLLIVDNLVNKINCVVILPIILGDTSRLTYSASQLLFNKPT